MKKMLIILGLLLIPIAYAQLDWSVTDLRCGDMVLDEYELCEEGVAESRCEDLSEWMGIDTACYEDHCTCLPLVNRAFCGNDRREGVEMCDGAGEDLCKNLSKAMNITLECNDKCGCDIVEAIPPDYNPEVIEQLNNQTQDTTTCGDKLVEGAEECDPPGTMCTTGLGRAGECTEECKCEEVDTLDPVTNETEPEQTNQTEPEPTVEINQTETNETTKEVEKPEKKGFFAKLWGWIVSLFS